MDIDFGDVDPEALRMARYVRDHIYENGLPGVRFIAAGKRAVEQSGGEIVEDQIGKFLK